jgi:hypothetical protein
MLAPQLPSRSASVSEFMEAATRVFRQTLAKSLPIAMFAILLAALPNMYWLTTGKPMDLLHPPLDRGFWVLTAVGFAGYQWLAAVLMLRQRALLGRGAADLPQEASAALARWPMLLVTAILAGAAIFIGALALLLPGVFALVCFLLLRPVVLFESLDPARTLLRCIRLVRPMWTKVLAAALIAALVFVVCAIAAAAALGIVQALAVAAGAKPAAMSAFAAACGLGVQAVALVYFNALWLVLYSAASSSA